MTGKKGQVWTNLDNRHPGIYLLLNLIDEDVWNCLVLNGPKIGQVVKVADLWFKIFARKIT